MVGHMGSPLFVRRVRIDWNALPDDSYVRGITALQDVDEVTFDAPVTFFVGENGSGKSTLLEAIALACGFNAEGGTRNYRFSTYDDVSELADAVLVERQRSLTQSSYFLRAESFFTMATKAREYAVGRSDARARLHEQSHGESFMSWIQSFSGPGLCVMDEPEAALSPQRQLSLLALLSELAQAGSQFIIATHSPVLLALPNATILSFDDGRMHPISYEDTESYRITDMIISRRESLLRHLIDEI